MRIAGRLLLALAVIAALAWTLVALQYQSVGLWRGLAQAAAVAAALMLGRQIWRGHVGRALAGLLGAAVVAGLWWSSIKPLADRDWAEDVARGVTGQVEEDLVTIRNVRDFTWSTPGTFTPAWRDETLRLSDLQTVDLVTSVWASPAIAHTLISFGFAGGRHIVFSAEIRRERGEAFSEIGGFFKEFELVLIAATEADIVRLRSDVRGESVSIFPLNLTPDQREALFRSYINLGNQLAENPRFYQTVTNNCTTIIWRLARTVDDRLPLDWRVLLSGYVPGYLHDLGLLEGPLEQVLQAARIAPQPDVLRDDFSGKIRRLQP
ncbi:DUF4105 domain-containing protein [Frigidibacter albus]|uniref:DUF4105 domain-containing protein n=1 Tax=Frigidibacter albus TaxID=1465486 RepID=A0A6L8VKC7_9RHOB|nr:DUF4105 domain-containing protein [Frigidibacter albus]MZQ90653.1 DUF4105 domain-containing protein [Frigidibacter albus]NBE32691.1 DUF4105 domain-containing protein [Frigidibacter albus]GGH60431.1 membrane protein [Frigidibacter albus]